MKNRLAIIGAGPIGLEAGLAALERDYEVQVFERGQVAQNIQEWGHVQMFSPFERNVSTRGLGLLAAAPMPNALLRGAEYVREYLEPLATYLGPRVCTMTRVVSVARVATLKYEGVRDPERANRPFRLLLREEGGHEWTALADIVFDCSGVWHTPNHLGDGGMPAIGEEECAPFLDYGVPDVLGTERAAYEGKAVLVVGSGHSAATVIRDVAKVGARIVWVTRRSDWVRLIAEDVLPARKSLSQAADELVRSGRVEHLGEQGVLALKPHSNRVSVTLTTEHGKEAFDFDRIVVCTGFRPDLSLTRELQVQTCWATEGTFQLSDVLLRASAGKGGPVWDGRADALMHPEPNFFTLGIKSYGRAPDFLIQTGLRQIDSALDWLDKHWVRQA